MRGHENLLLSARSEGHSGRSELSPSRLSLTEMLQTGIVYVQLMARWGDETFHKILCIGAIPTGRWLLWTRRFLDQRGEKYPGPTFGAPIWSLHNQKIQYLKRNGNLMCIGDLRGKSGRLFLEIASAAVLRMPGTCSANASRRPASALRANTAGLRSVASP